MADLSSLKPGEIYLLVTPFLPAPPALLILLLPGDSSVGFIRNRTFSL
jgi:hypothetical protein